MHKDTKQVGSFYITPENPIYGELTIDEGNTLLYLRDTNFINMSSLNGNSINGVLHDFTKVTLINCSAAPVPGTFSSKNDGYYFADVFPHHIVHGDSHINPNDKCIRSIRFVVDDARILFYDFDAFGRMLDARPCIENVVQSNKLERKITIGTNPEILYFTGKTEIFSAKTKYGLISASHNPKTSWGGSEGVFIKNTIVVSIEFNENMVFDDALNAMFITVKFLEVTVGRPQNIQDILIDACEENNSNGLTPLKVYLSYPPKRDSSMDERKPHPASVLLDAINKPDDFSRVLSKWLEVHHLMHDSRMRFFESFSSPVYNINRLVASANMFDILPREAAPSDVDLSEDLTLARNECRYIFKKLPISLERSSVLNALGRMGQSTLKHKVRYRGQILLAAFNECFENLFVVTDAAINCRNHYVHGSDGDFNYADNFDLVIFFTDTLEFIFAVSDLIEAKWDFKEWYNKGSSISHPFAQFRDNYFRNFNRLKQFLHST